MWGGLEGWGKGLAKIIGLPKLFREDIIKQKVIRAKRGAERRAKWVYNLVAREARAPCVNRVWVLASCKLTALIFTCIYPMVSAMTSYSSLTSRRIFVSRQHSTESDYDKVFMKSCLFIVCKTMSTIGESQAISHANRTANTSTPNCQSS